ncbi:RagB/SusD family nutrient uptake outer membrane protein [Pedobacter sp.]|uniref:RagB/SusD family nutrient uptake outer membrane protein n=1 Tax=Pedobacter sp. TaxID=1411316 RepID=UPI003D7FDBB0
MKINILLFAILLSVLTLNSCKDYLEVSPKSSISEEALFDSEVGFEQALVGIYAKLSAANLYGDKLSLGFVSALAQNYNMTSVGAPYTQTTAYNYAADECKTHISNIWSSSYNAIAGLNKILKQVELKKSILSPASYAMIKGEALALRSYLHFDLLRLFGPHPQKGANLKAIPFEENADNFVNSPLTTSEVLNNILRDLELSASLMKNYEPAYTEDRQIKLNYYAVKGLDARVSLYSGDKARAAAAAKIVVESKQFPFVNISTVAAVAGSKNRLFKSELVFALRSRNMQTWTDSYFRYKLNTAWSLRRPDAEINTLYENSSTDIRRVYLFEEEQNTLYTSKFWQTYTLSSGESQTSTGRMDQLVPMIRISEMYYILAETAATVEEGIKYINLVRSARAITTLPTTNIASSFLENEIKKEYQKEFYAEGQLFFYYKRMLTERIQFLTPVMNFNNYVLPIPETELEYNPNY